MTPLERPTGVQEPKERSGPSVPVQATTSPALMPHRLEGGSASSLTSAHELRLTAMTESARAALAITSRA
jgi:hypothetical protein